MAASRRSEDTSQAFDDLDDLMASLDGPALARAPSTTSTASRPPTRPISLAFPGRAPSRNSSRSRLSTHSSNRSLQSLASAQSAQSPGLAPSSPPPMPSGLAGPARLRQTSEPPVSLGAGPDDEITPSLSQGEWSQAPTPSSVRSHSRTYHRDDASSIASGDRPLSPGIRSHPPSPRISSRRSPSPPRLNNSPLRLIPRSPLKDRTPLEDLAYFEEMDAAAGDHWEAQAARTDTDSLSVLSGSTGTGPGGRMRTTSTRSQRLREDIERTAERLRASASQEQLERPSLDTRGSESSAGPASPNVSSSGVPLYPGAPTPADNKADDSPLLASIHSNGSPSLQTTPQLGSSAASIARSEREEKRASVRPRQKELREWSQSCLMWQRGDGKSGHGGLLSKTPLIREVPGAVKRKMNAKRESSQLLSPAEALLYGMDDSKSRSSPKSKDKDKAGVMMGPNASAKDGSWRKVTSVLRDDGYLRLFSEDKIILHSIHLPSGPRTDIRLVDQSLFDRPNCVVVHRRAHVPFTPFQPGFNPNSFSSTSSFASSSSPSSLNAPYNSRTPPSPTSEEPIYLSMPSVVAMETWMVMAHCFAQPEFFVCTGATTPRPMRRGSLATASTGQSSSNGHYGGAEASEDDDLLHPETANGNREDDTRYRIYRSLTISINEGRGIGDAGVEIIRDRPKTSSDNWRGDREGSSSTSGSTYEGVGVDQSPAKSISSRMPPRSESSHGKDEQISTFCELVLEGVVLARTSVRKGTNNPYWNETFTLSDLPPFLEPLTIRIFQSHKTHRPSLLGVCTVRLPDLPRSELIDSWWPVRSPAYDVRSRSTETVGELSLAVRVGEEVVLPSGEYQPILQLLIDDTEAELPSDLASEFPSDLEELSRLLLRIYHSEGLVLPRICRLVDLEVGNSTKSAAILFRGNTILTKSVELYLRRVGREFLDASIGDIVRRLCTEKVEIEIDPSRMKPGVKDKELQHNVHELLDWTSALWNSIYDARNFCPDDVRRIFSHIQQVAERRYGEEQKYTRWTSVSAFVFLRFFVPAVLNPKLFGIVASPPDPKSQRTLTLIAKTLQGLANFAAFGQKEPWMLAMNSFVQDNTSAFVDFIEHISTPAGPTSSPQEWTSPNAAVYIAPYRLRSSLPPLVREGVPLLPHLVDLPRNLGLLAAHIAKGVVEKGPPPIVEGRSDSPSISSSRGRSAKFTDLAEACIDVHEEARRRGGGLVPPLYAQPREKKSSARPATTRMTNSWARKTASSAPPPPLPTQPSTPPPRSSPLLAGDDIMHIRAAAPPGTPPHSIGPAGGAAFRSPQSEQDSIASRRSHRSYTINGASPSSRRGGGNVLHALSTSEDLTSSSFTLGSFPSPKDGATPTLPPLAGASSALFDSAATAGDVFTDGTSFASLVDEDEAPPSPTVESNYTFPSRGSKVPVQVTQSTTTSWAIVPEEEVAPNVGGKSTAQDESSLHESTFKMPFSVPMQTTNSSSSWASIPSSASSIAEVSVGRRPSLPMSTGSSSDLFTLGGKGSGEGKSKGFFSRRKGSKAS